MEAFLDLLWQYMVVGCTAAGDTLFQITQFLHPLGPALIISVLAALTVCITKTLNRLIITKRYVELEKTYHHWLELRQEALQCDDREKGQRMARNIDKAELNKAYYDYFFEGLLLGLARKVIPIFFVFAFINEYYKPSRLQEFFGANYVVAMPSMDASPVLIGSVFWFFISLITCYIVWSVMAGLLKKRNSNQILPAATA